MENLEDVSSGGRVTRSLRKRLTSVDSNDAGSRPTTPQLIKLTSIPESSSPSRSLRMTRRNSTSGNGTPLKALPKSKTSIITETQDTENSPAKRTTRRSSISALNTPSKSNQEDEAKKINPKEMPARRVTRLQSKSPPQADVEKKIGHASPTKNKSGLKFSRNKVLTEESDSDVEVINLEEDHEEETNITTPKVGKMAEKTPTKLPVTLKVINNPNENIETIDLSNETVVIDDVENQNLHKENEDSKSTTECSAATTTTTLNQSEKEELNVDSVHTDLECKTVNEMIDLTTPQSDLPHTDLIEKNDTNKILDTKECTPQSAGNISANSVKSAEKLASPLKNISNSSHTESIVNNNFTPQMEDKAEETQILQPIETIYFSGDVLVEGDATKAGNVNLHKDTMDSSKLVEPQKLKECEENIVQSLHPDSICVMTNVANDVQTSQLESLLTDPNRKTNTEEIFEKTEDAIHLAFSEDDEELKDSNNVSTSEKSASPQKNIPNSSHADELIKNFASTSEEKGEEIPAGLASTVEVIETMDLSDDVLVEDNKTKSENVHLQKDETDNTRSEDLVKPMEKKENHIESLHRISKIAEEDNYNRVKTPLSETPHSNYMKKTDDKEVFDKKECTHQLQLSGNDEELEDGTTFTTPEKIASPFKNKATASLVESVIMLRKLSPKVIARLCNENNVLSPKNSKSVTFHSNNLDDDDVAKSSYPKTPASIKMKSYISKDSSKNFEDTSISSDNSSLVSFQNASAHTEEFQGQNEYKNKSVSTINEAEDHSGGAVEIRQDKTPHKQIPSILHSSTPVCDSIMPSKSEPEPNAKNVSYNAENSQVKSPKKSEDENVANINKGEELTNSKGNVGTTINEDEAAKPIASLSEQQKKEVASTIDINGISTELELPNSNNGNEKSDNENSVKFAKSWTHNVSGCATSEHKIDNIADNSSINKQLQDPDSKDIKAAVNEKTPTEASEINIKDVESEASNDSFQRSEFVDDEAMEAPDDYQSGDSMDEDERKEMEENEILEDGESIGSEDTLSDRSNDDEDDEDNASFVTSHSDESLLEYSDEDEDIHDTTKKGTKTKRNKRIMMITSESEDDAQSLEENKAKLTNGGITKKETNKSTNRRNCILASSESESDEEFTTKFTKENENIAHSKDGLEKSLNFDVTKMIDASTDDEININETLPQDQNINSTNMKLINSKEKSNANENDEGDCNNDGKNNGGDYKSESEIESNALQQSNRKTYSFSLNAANKNEFNVSNSSSKNARRKSLLISTSQAKSIECGDKAEIEMADNGHNGNSDASPITAVSKDTDQTDMKTKKKLNSSNVSVISMDSPTGTVIDANKKCSQNGDVYEFRECENDIPQSENESSEAEKGTGEEDIEIPETQEVEHADGVFHDESSVDEELLEDIDSRLKVSSNLKSKGLSVSFCQAKYKRDDIKSNKYAQHRSFSIGDESETYSQSGKYDSSNVGEESNEESNSIDSTSSNEGELEREEVEKLELLKHSNLQFPTLKSKRQSLVSYDAQDNNERTYHKKPKRKSMQALIKEKFNPSKSLIESFQSRRRELDTIKAKKSRLSKSFCETMEAESKGLAGTNTSSNSSDESYNKSVKNSSTPHNLNQLKNNKKDYSSILERCDQILEAANRAKLEAKQNAKKSKIMLPKSKKSSKRSASSEEESANQKSTVALEQALRASAKILINEGGKTKKIKPSLQTSEVQPVDNRLPMQILDSFSDEDSWSKCGKNKCHDKPRHALLQRMNCASGEVIEEVLTPKKKKRDILKKIELPTGIVLEEPVTPTKKTNKSGFRESPITPRNLGFKVRHILTAGQDKVPELRGASHNAERKRKRKIIDHEHILPKPQWSQSGVFIEEMLPSCNDKKRFKYHATNASGSVDNSSALKAFNFKHSTIFRKNVPRESSHEVLQRKERQCVSRKYF